MVYESNLRIKILQNLLTKIYVAYEKNQVLDKELCKSFNIFSILNIERKEVETHSFFIYELLNPNGLHNQGLAFIDLFLKHILKLENYGDIKKVYREDPTQENRRIDFTIETSKYQIAIEMKVDASDQHNQLLDYFNEMKMRCDNSQESKVFYLTLFGSDADKDSHNNITYNRLSFSDDIIYWIELCIKESVVKPVVRELLLQYKYLLEKITNQNKDLEMETKSLIESNKENFTSAYEIYRSFELAATSIEIKFWKKLIEELRTANINIYKEIEYEEISKARRSSKEINILFKITEINENTDLMLQVGAKSSWANGGIYATIFQYKDELWDNGPDQFITKSVADLTVANFRKASWCYGSTTLDDNIQLRSEKLFDAINHIDSLVMKISTLIAALKDLKIKPTTN